MDAQPDVGTTTRLSLFCDRLIEAGWLAIAAVVPVFFNLYSSRIFAGDKLTLLRAIVLIMAVAAIISTLERLPAKFEASQSIRRFIKDNPLTLPVLLFAFVYLLTSITSVAPSVSLWGSYVRVQGALTTIGYITLFFLVAHHLRTKAQLDRVVSVILLTSLPVSLFAIVQHLNLDPLPWTEDVTNRVSSTMGNAIFLAGYLIMVVPFTLVRLASSLWSWLKLRAQADTEFPLSRFLLALAYLTLLVLQLAAILFTKSRGPWLGLGIGLIVLASLWASRRPSRRPRLLVLSGSFVLGSLLLLLNLPLSPVAEAKKLSPYLERMGSLLDLESGSNKVRMLIWFGDDVGGGIRGMARASPWRSLIGYGPETIYLVFNRFYPPELAQLQEGRVDRSHSDYLDSLATMGVLGLLSQLALIATFFVLSVRLFRHSQSSAQRILLAGVISAVSAHVVEAFFGIGVAVSRTYFWLYLAMTIASAQMLHAPVTPDKADPARKLLPTPEAVSRGRGNVPGIKERNRGWWPLAIYLFLTFATLPPLLLIKGVQPLSNPPLVVGLGFAWLLLGLYLATLWLRSPALVPRQRARLRWWAYMPLASITVLLLFLLLSGVVADTYFKIAQAYQKIKAYEIAVPTYRKAVDWAPREDYYYLALGAAYLGAAKTLSNQSPAIPTSTQDNAQREINREQLFEASLMAITEANRLNPLDTNNSLYLARLYASWGELTAQSETKKDRLAQAINRYEKAIDLSPNYPLLYDELAMVYHLLGQGEKVMSSFQRALELDQRYPTTYAYMGNVLKDQGQLGQAESMYEQAATLDPKYALNLITLGDTYRDQEQQDRAEALYLKAIAFDRSSIRAHSSLSYLYYKQEKIEAALAENLKVLELAPKDLAAHTNLALIYQKLKLKAKALVVAKMALRLATPAQQPGIRVLIAELEEMEP